MLWLLSILNRILYYMTFCVSLAIKWNLIVVVVVLVETLHTIRVVRLDGARRPVSLCANVIY